MHKLFSLPKAEAFPSDPERLHISPPPMLRSLLQKKWKTHYSIWLNKARSSFVLKIRVKRNITNFDCGLKH